jgi:hypothetical protein
VLVGQPVECDVVEDVISCKAFGLPVEYAGDHQVTADIVIDHPRGESDRRIRDAIERLRRFDISRAYASPFP